MSHEQDWQDGASDYPTASHGAMPGAEDDLEAGIAAVFEAIRNNGGDFDADAEGDGSHEAEIADDGTTFALLSELNRLWQQSPH